MGADSVALGARAGARLPGVASGEGEGGFSVWPAMIRALRGRLALASLASLVGGGASTGLVVLINQALHAPDPAEAGRLAVFAATSVAAAGGLVVSRALFADLGQRSLADLRRAIAERVQAAPFGRLEAVGSARIQALVAEDSNQIANLLVALPILVTNGVIVVSTLAYLAILSVPLFLASLVVIGLGAAGYSVCYGRVGTHLAQAGREQDQLFQHFLALGAGAKELRLNRGKARRFLDEILARAVDGLAHHRSRGLAILAVAGGWGRLLFLALIGMTLFLPLGGARDPAVTTGYVVAFLYLMGPLEAVLSTMPLIGMARVGAARIAATFADLPPEPTGVVGQASRTATVTLAGLTHRMRDAGTGDSFVLGPVDLVLSPGQTTFLVGGNGCGKTTLAKVVAGLYAPEAGSLALDGHPVTEAGRAAFRQHVSAVFSDFHLFETLLETPSPDLDARARAWLALLGLDGRVTVRDGRFSTRDLSTGQRKRLALVAACLEDRPVMIFDEWAADQDPAFRAVFYDTILPELRARGKTLLVITHDDRYFDRADQLVKLDRGTIVGRDRAEAAR
ncbi:cyclic peptide export ABC transporter [Methylobacterium sp. J-068]|uniref:cyclic peptide export ABC transporter n=1 Tax=Methylobacterium sp. J-068 TaxID=2836649 RepID=UPI001FB9BEFA|nr:cyclic peptide export ABC transporter [Methylobacterium sp. J-068]MCJ2036203.1 cyclic peptide export ABC transporter [Methylobacterium sp. J-068]